MLLLFVSSGGKNDTDVRLLQNGGGICFILRITFRFCFMKKYSPVLIAVLMYGSVVAQKNVNRG